MRNLANFRDLGDYSPVPKGLFARSNNPCQITKAECEELKLLGFTSVLDLRREKETLEYPDLLQNHADFSYHRIILNNITYASLYDISSPDGLASAYVKMLGISIESTRDIFSFLSEHPGTVFHCESGKDRTGMVACILLLLAGASDKDIIKDYALTYQTMYLMGDPLCLEDSAAPPSEEVMILTLEKFRAKYNTAEAYLNFCGLKNQDIIKLKNILRNKF